MRSSHSILSVAPGRGRIDEAARFGEPSSEIRTMMAYTRRQALGFAAGALAAHFGVGAAKAAVDQYPKLRRGINIHHMLNWPETHFVNGRVEYVWPPFQTARYQTSNSELLQLRNLGFDFVRLTADPSILMTAGEDRWDFLGNHIRDVVQRLLAVGMNVVLDLHPVAVNPDYRPELLVESGTSHLFGAYVAMVGRVAGLLREFPSDRLVFELMNEPRITSLSDAAKWQPMLESLHASARAAAPALPLLLTGMLWGDRKALMKLDTAPFRASNVLYTFHYYDPHTFTHQGAMGDDAQFISGLSWPATEENVAEVEEAATKVIAARTDFDADKQAACLRRTKKLLRDFLATNSSAESIGRDFEEVASWARANGIASDRIVLGEFACVVASNGANPGSALQASGSAWLATVRKAAEASGFSWAYWAYKGHGGMEMADAAGNFHEELFAPLGLSR